jgi:two-component system phosphate regulon response regulator OmpR
MSEAPSIPERHILVVDDDDRLRALLKQYLSEQGFFVSTAADTQQADALLQHFVVDLMVLDVMMPRESGIEYAQRLRGDAAAPPILLLTARVEAEDRIAGLESGAQDYLAKPFAPRELLLRMENILQRSNTATPSVATAASVQFGDYRFDLQTGRLTSPEGAIYLTSSEIECLRILAESAGQPVSRERMAELAGDLNNERSVDVQINRLRKKIEPQPSKPLYIQTVRHAGYVLHAQRGA